MTVMFRPFIALTDWNMVQRKLGIRWVSDTKGIIAFDEATGKVLAGCILNNWTYSAVQAHFWIDNPVVIRAGFFHEICRYVFIDAGRDKMIGLIPADNEEALHLDAKIGFKETHRVKGGYMHDVDYVIMEADRHDLSKWLDEEKWHGRRRKEGRTGRTGLRSSGGSAGAGFERSHEHADLREPTEPNDAVRVVDVDPGVVH